MQKPNGSRSSPCAKPTVAAAAFLKPGTAPPTRPGPGAAAATGEAGIRGHRHLVVTLPQSFGAGLKSHVHFHILVSDGVYFPDGDYYALGFWDEPSLLRQLRHSILKSLVARKCLQPETAEVLESWPLERSGFSAFVGTATNQPAERPRLERVLRYIFRPSLPLKHLSYRETTGQVTYSPPGALAKIWASAYDFLADWVQHIPRAKQHQITYAGAFANALGKLNPKPESAESSEAAVSEVAPKPKWVRWPRRGSRTRAP